MTALQQHLHQKLMAHFQPEHLQVINESHLHGTPSNDSHYKVVMAADAFEGMRLLQRHRAVNQLFVDELAGPVHALALHLYTPAEWQELGNVPQSPQCLGGSTLDTN